MTRELRLRSAYRREVRDLADGTCYWHLYWKGERVNGGLSDSRAGALAAAEHALVFDLAGAATCPPWPAGGTPLLP